MLTDAWRLTKAYWQSEDKKWAWGLLITIIVLNLGIVAFEVWYNFWNNTFYDTLAERNFEGFKRAMVQFCVLVVVYIVVAGYQFYLRNLLMLRWRKWLTAHYVDRWLRGQTYYGMKLLDSNNTDNPDQRISEDINLFTTDTLALTLDFLREMTSLTVFIIILWRLSGIVVIPVGHTVITISGYLVWASIGYAILGSGFMYLLGRPLANLTYRQQRLEADFRFSLMRLRENSESVALYKGEAREKQAFLDRFSAVYTNCRQIIKLNKQVTWLQSGYVQIRIIAGMLAGVPRYFAGRISFGTILQISNAFGNVQDSLSFFVLSFTTMAEWKAVVDRLSQFTGNMEKVEALDKESGDIERVSGEQNLVHVDNLSICRPDGYSLLAGLNLRVEPGERLLVTGFSGCGKSTLLRTLAGIWPFGQGRIVLPAGRKTLFVPQKSYFPLGSLRETLSYPGVDQPLRDEELRAALRSCRLEFLTDKLDTLADWAQVLSLGEQQRLAFVRVLLQQPELLFLDEATSSIDEDMEETVYQLLLTGLPGATIISVGHRSTLMKYHQRKLAFTGGGQWQIGVV